MADTKLYNILSSLYTGEQKLAQRDRDIITGWLGYETTKPDGTTQKTVDARLDSLEAGTSAASGTLTIGGKAYTPSTGDKEITTADIMATYVTAPAVDAAGLAAASAVYAADKNLQDQIDNIASSYITGAIDPADNVLSLGVDVPNQKISGAIAVDGTTVIKSASGLKTAIQLSAVTPNSTDYAAAYRLVDNTGTPLDGDVINIPKDQFLKNAAYDSATEELVLTFELVHDGSSATPKTTEVRIDVKDLVHEYVGSSAIDVANTLSGNSAISLKLDTVTAGTESGDGKFLSITANGLLLSGVQAAIDAAKGEEATELAELSGKVSGAFGSDAAANVVTTANGGITKSAYTLGTGALAADPSATTLATEKAVADAIAAGDDALEAKLSPAYALDEIVLGAGTDTGLKASSYKLGADTDVYTDTAPAAKTVMTEASFYKYVETDLTALDTAVTNLVNGLGNM